MDHPTIEVIARGLWVVGSHVLLCRNRKHGHVFLPGGHVEFGESASEALAREFLEETSQRVRVGPFLGGLEASFIQRRGSKSKGGATKRSARSTARTSASHAAADGQIDPDRHHEVNLFFAVLGLDSPARGIRAAKHRASAPLARASASPLPVIVSAEEKIEFFWSPISRLLGPRPKVLLLPRAAVPLLRRAAQRPSQPKSRGPAPDWIVEME